MNTFRAVSERPDFPKLEEEILEYWKKIGILDLVLKETKGRPNYSFYDGPPFATGLPHYGHILAGTIKDIVTRYATQKGFYCERRFGWDCHGLPVEHEIDKKLNITSKEDVLKMGIGEYNEACRSIVLRYTQEWRSTIERVGRLIDFDNGYRTMDKGFMQTVWWVFKQLFEKNLVYRAYRVMPYSTACSTPLSNFECNLNYKDVSDPSVILTFPNLEDQKIQYLAWTTTPWTLPSNIGIAVNPELKYVYFKPENSENTYVVCESRLEWVLSELKISKYQIVSDCLGAELHNVRYIPLFDYFKQHKSSGKFWRILADSYVVDNAGTGLVQMAPAFGEDDFRVCVENDLIDSHGITLPSPMDANGRFTEPVNDFIGLWFKDADKPIKQFLKKNGRLLSDNTCVHSYPFCWRSDTPLQYRAVPSWFINVESLKEKLVHNNSLTNWVPNYVKEKRFHNWLQDARDWCVSRNRFWGTPIPIWVSEDYSVTKCIGSVDELKSLAINLPENEDINDLHRHFIDKIEIRDPRGDSYPPLRRIEEVFDCWFESGSMPYASIEYPFKNEKEFDHLFPADFVGEGLDQTRGWFYTLMVLSTAIFDKPAFENVIVNGLVLASDGKKMSKRLKNYPDPIEIVDKYGADALRIFLINSPVVRAETLRFKEEGVKDIVKDVLLPWYHCYRFFVQEATRFENTNSISFTSNKDVINTCKNVMDIWIYSEAQSLLKYVKTEMDQYKLYSVTPRLISFLDILCNWYVRLNRDRMRGAFGFEETKSSLEMLFEILILTVKLLAPIAPFTCEILYSNLKNAIGNQVDRKETVHLLYLPQVNEKFINKEIEDKILQLREIIVMGRAMREKKKVGLKTPIKSICIIHKDTSVLEYFIEAGLINYIKDELNTIEVIADKNFEYDKITKMVATPNFKVLGSKLGKSMKEVTKYIKNMSNEDIQKFISEGFVSICGFELNSEEIIVQTVIDNSLTNSKSDFLYEGSSQFVIGIDFTFDIEFEKMAYARELANKIQKIRKEKNMDPDANVTICLELISNNDKSLFSSVIESYNDYLYKIIRKPIEEYNISKINQNNIIFDYDIEVSADRIKVTVVCNN
ncbi:isoleucine-tRNA synthetase [Cryptosporidium bovis]|uniref:isoleucine-tRNA synthetase n=1 Tax=Cryptosporidium bovis TaxID=310047 RepID=UPI00351A9BD9|nr:isoleucine-tRNA synthetase [Cryptosporidium bovis]